MGYAFHGHAILMILLSFPENSRQPWLFTGAGFLLGLLIVVADQLLPKQPSINVSKLVTVTSIISLYKPCSCYPNLTLQFSPVR